MANNSIVILKMGILILIYSLAGCDSRIKSTSSRKQISKLDTQVNLKSIALTTDSQSVFADHFTKSKNSISDSIEFLNTSSLPKPPPTITSTLAPEMKDSLAPKSTIVRTKDSVITDRESTQNNVNSVSIHEIWERLLQTHVGKDGRVNYKGFIRDSTQLNRYLNLLSQIQPDGLAENDRIAYWINAYNAFTIDLIIQNYPVKSIMDLDKGKIWDRKWIILNQKSLSLNDIEHNILFKLYPDARYHFALVCAAKSCPPLYTLAWEGYRLEKNLHERTALFINDTSFNKINNNSLSLSKIFDWYRSDFKDIIGFINRYYKTKVADDALVTFTEYDWDLNER